MRDMFQRARDHADEGDDKLKGEVIARINQVERTITTLAEQLGALRSLLAGESVPPIHRAPRFPAFVKDWRFWVAIIGAIIAARSPDMLPHFLKLFGV